MASDGTLLFLMDGTVVKAVAEVLHVDGQRADLEEHHYVAEMPE